MKLFTKWLPLMLAMLLTLSACRTRETVGDADPTKTDDGAVTTAPNGGSTDPLGELSLKEIYDDFISEVEAELPSLTETAVNRDNFEYYFGVKKTSDVTETFVSEPGIGSIPFGISLLRVKDGVDADKLAGQMKSGINPRRWVCVEASYAEVAVRGNVILLVLDGDNARGAEILEAFKNL